MQRRGQSSEVRHRWDDRVRRASLALLLGLAANGCSPGVDAPGAASPGTDASGAASRALAPTASAQAAVPTAVPATPDEVVAWLDQRLVPLSLEMDAPATDVAAAVSSFAQKRVIAMGEATHGTKEFFEIKHRFFRYLVKNHGFRTLAMEMKRDAGRRVDAYLKTGEGDPSALVQGSYFFFDSQELVALLKWMRTYNTRAPSSKQLSFFGMDVPGTPAAATIDNKCGVRHGCRVFMRDGFMAQHISTFVAKHDGGVLVWAHNGHVAHFKARDGWKPMGQYLREEYGDDYYAIGFEFDHGGFVAPAGGSLPVTRNATLQHLDGRVVSEYTLGPAPADAIAHRLAKARVPNYLITFDGIDAPARAFFNSHRNLQTYGSMAPKKARSYERYDAPLNAIFDALIFVRTTHGYTFTR